MAEELLDIQPLELKFTCKYTKFRIPPFSSPPPPLFFNLKIMMLSFVFMVITVIYLSSGRKGLF